MDLDPHTSKIRALVVADSLFMGMKIAEILNDDVALEVVGRATDVTEALNMVEELLPDVIAMDVDMSKTDGITALRHLMAKQPTPTVVISSCAKEGSGLVFDALRFGAVDVIPHPSAKSDESPEGQRALIVSSVKRAATMRVKRISYRRGIVTAIRSKRASHGVPDQFTHFVCISALVNGYYCFLRIIPTLPAGFGDVLIGTIVAAPRNVEAFASYLERHSAVPVKNLRKAGTIEKGACYLCSIDAGLVLESDARGGLHFRFQDYQDCESPWDGSDRLMSSLAAAVGPRAVGLIIGHGGPAGSEGIEEIRRAGGTGLVRDVTDWGSPGDLEEILTRNKAKDSSFDQTQQQEDGIPYQQACSIVGEQTGSEGGTVGLDSEIDETGGYVRGIDIIDYLQFVLLTGRPTVLEVFSDNGVTGQIYVRNGNVLHAQYGDLQGDQALYRCLASQGGSFLNRPWRDPQRISVNKPGELVLTEAARRRDAARSEWVQVAN